MSPSFWRNSRKGIRQLSGKVAVVTGAASGIGRGLALGLWEKGCHLALVDLDPGGLTRLHAELGRSGGDQTATTHVADVGERARMRDLAGELVRETAARATDPVKADIDRRHREIIQRLAAEIRENPGQARAVAELARVAGYSVDHFSRVFEKVAGQRPQDWVIEARLVRARQLLAETHLTVGQIGEALGFRDVFFFSRQFRQKTGRTPTEFRSSLRDRSGGTSAVSEVGSGGRY